MITKRTVVPDVVNKLTTSLTISAVSFLLLPFELNKIWATFSIITGKNSIHELYLSHGKHDREFWNTLLGTFHIEWLSSPHLFVVYWIFSFPLYIVCGHFEPIIQNCRLHRYFFFKWFLLFSAHIFPLTCYLFKDITLTRLISHAISNFFKTMLK